MIQKEVNIMLVYRSGGCFTLDDVHLLCKHLQIQKGDLKWLNIYCITDVVDQTITLSDVTLLPMQYHLNGWWSKMNLFSPVLNELRPFLYLDLDTAILKPINSILLPSIYAKGFIMLRDFYRPRHGASGIMWIPKYFSNPKIEKIWDAWHGHEISIVKKFRGDQEFINSVVTADYFWQDFHKSIVTYKPDNGRSRRLKLDGGESIVCFHGKPKINDAAKQADWVKRYVEFLN